MITTQQSCWEWSFLDKADSSCLICWNFEIKVSITEFHAVSDNQKKKRKHSYFLFQVCFHFHNKVESLESSLQLLTIYVGPSAILQLALRLKLHVVYDEAKTTRPGIHLIALTHTKGKQLLQTISMKVMQDTEFRWLTNLRQTCSCLMWVNERYLPEDYPVAFCPVVLVCSTLCQVLQHQ